MAYPSKAEKVKVWVKEYLSEFRNYTGTLDELANLANSTPYLVKKALTELEKENLIKVESKRGKGFAVTLNEQKEKPQEIQQVRKTEEKKKKQKKPSLQDQVLSSLVGKEITVFLVSGTRLEGRLLDFDNFTLAMTAPKGKSLVYKHSIATIIFD